MPDPIPAEAVQAAIDGVDHEYVERRGFDANAARAALTAAAPVLAAQARATAVTALRAIADSPGLLHRFVDRHAELHDGVTVRGVLLAVADEIEGDARDSR
ncbi:hypothetical protein ACIBQ6_21980 [Nonomuraea sp. NPDC049655]|uniref:hypothetical protein n=1 Tax=Nonomuraea sp. NPDC049655 TaxID=3364355 RepID=UPI0037898CD0